MNFTELLLYDEFITIFMGVHFDYCYEKFNFLILFEFLNFIRILIFIINYLNSFNDNYHQKPNLIPITTN